MDVQRHLAASKNTSSLSELKQSDINSFCIQCPLDTVRDYIVL